MYSYFAYPDMSYDVYGQIINSISQNFPELIGQQVFTTDFETKIYTFSKDGQRVISILYQKSIELIAVESEIDLDGVMYLIPN